MLSEPAIASVLLAPGSNPLYGLNTLGGARVLTTRSGSSHPGLSGGSHRHRRADFSGGGASDGWHAFAAGTPFRDRGWRDHSDGRLGNLFLKAGRIQTAMEWQLTVLGGDSRLTCNGLLPDAMVEDSRRAAYTWPDTTRNRLRQAQLSATVRPRDHVQWTAAAYLRNSRRDTVNGDISGDYAEYVEQPDMPIPTHTASLNSTATRQRSCGASLQLAVQWPVHQWLAGVALDRSRVHYAQYEQEGLFTPQRGVLGDDNDARALEVAVEGAASSTGFYLTDTWQLTPGTWLTGSARYNRARVGNTISNDGVQQAHESFNYRRLNPALGIAHEAGRGWTVFANAAQSNRAPAVIELGCADPEQPCRLPVGLQSDPFLKQVASRTVEAGARWQRGRDMAAATLYRTANHDDILFRSAGLAQHGYFANFSRTVHQGADVSVAMHFGAFGARIAYSWLDAVYGMAGSLFTGARQVSIHKGTRIAGLPRQTLKLGLDWKVLDTMTLGTDARLVSGQGVQGNEDGGAGAAVAQRMGGYGLLSLRATYKPQPGVEWYARIDNVANSRYETFGAVAANLFPGGQLLRTSDAGAELSRFVAPGAPRALSFGLRYRY